MLFLKKVEDPYRFSVAEVVDNKIISMEEKPQNPKSDLAVVGLYFYDSTIFDKIKTLKPSNRGELEITDVNNLYLNEGRVGFCTLDGFWSDAGTMESRKFCEDYVRKGLEQKVFKSLGK
jgi:glucose-1-phosphate thymidylyltransferase